jgi:hypothetical protein
MDAAVLCEGPLSPTSRVYPLPLRYLYTYFAPSDSEEASPMDRADLTNCRESRRLTKSFGSGAGYPKLMVRSVARHTRRKVTYPRLFRFTMIPILGHFTTHQYSSLHGWRRCTCEIAEQITLEEGLQESMLEVDIAVCLSSMCRTPVGFHTFLGYT